VSLFVRRYFSPIMGLKPPMFPFTSPLIASPSKSLSRDITDGKDSPVVIKVDGSGNNLTEVRSTFELDRGVSVAYDSIKFNGVNYANIATGVKKYFKVL
jgi:hypothetical protein